MSNYLCCIHSPRCSLRYCNKLCVPREKIREVLLVGAHSSTYLTHSRNTTMRINLIQSFQWSGMKKIAWYVARCLVCQQVKVERQHWLLQPSSIQESIWDKIAMDFVTGHPRGLRGNNAVWVVVDWLTKSAYFIPFCIEHPTKALTKQFMQETIRLHRVPTSIALDRDSRFESNYWNSHVESVDVHLDSS